MKTNRLNPGVIILLLGIVTFFTILSLAELPDLLFDLTFTFTLWGSIISLALLIVFCLLSARLILWAYSRVKSPPHPRQIFIYGFLISVVGIFIGITPGILQGQYLTKLLEEQVPDLPSSTGYINFLSIGFESLLFTCAITTITLLWIARWKKIKEEFAPLFSHVYRKQDVILVISTLVVYTFLIKNMMEFVILSFGIFSWRLTQ